MTAHAALSWLLAPLGWLYGLLMKLRRSLYQRGTLLSHQLPGCVISVGNLEAGGTGKSPIVIHLAQSLVQSGAKPAILTRGYHSGLGPEDCAVLLGPETIVSPASQRDFHADEAKMQAECLGNVPVIIGAKRWAAALLYLKKYPAPTHWILDDGFQHLQLKRQIDIVLLDAQKPFSNGRCLPAGRLREWPSTLKHAQLLILTRAHSTSLPKQLHPLVQAHKIPIESAVFTNGEPRQVAGPAMSWTETGALLLALGIAQPQRVMAHAEQLKLPIKARLIVGDHEIFPHASLQQLAENSDAILTTEKDYWRQAETFLTLNKPVFVLPLELRFRDGMNLLEILRAFTQP